MTKNEVLRIFREQCLPAIREQYEQDGRPDYPARCEAWSVLTDSLCKDRQITLKQYESWSAPPECGK